MTVSVIVPNYNHAAYLEKRLESILDQTYQDFEIILLDDCSTDGSVSIIEKYKRHPKVSTVIYNETNSGSPFAQWKKGIDLASGELIWIAESDDWCEKEFLEVLVKGIQKYPNCVVAFVQSYCMKDDKTVKWQSEHSKEEECLNGEVFFRERLIYGCTIFNVSMAIFKKESALQIRDSYTRYTMTGDWLFWIDICRLGNIYINARILNYFRKNDTAVSSRAYATGQNYIEELKILTELKDEKRTDKKLIYNSVFNKYNNLQKKREIVNGSNLKKIYQLFYRLLGNKTNFYRFLLIKKIQLLIRKIKLRYKFYKFCL